MLEVEFAQLSDNGRTRDHNEDYLGYVSPATPEEARTHGWLFALADGVGGQAHGEVASREAVECLLAGFREAPVAESPLALLTRLVKAANTHVFQEAHAHSQEGSGMATTLVACALRYDRATVAHVGDSRCYLVRRGHAHALTRDHTLANEQLRMGMLSEREAANADHRHLLVRSVGSDMFVNPEVSDHQVFTGDVLVLCSDGLHGSVTGSDLGRIAGPDGDLSEAAEKLVELANERDGSDNISVQLIRVRSVERVGMYRGRPYRLPG
jgi:protein phosphatase